VWGGDQTCNPWVSSRVFYHWAKSPRGVPTPDPRVCSPAVKHSALYTELTGVTWPDHSGVTLKSNTRFKTQFHIPKSTDNFKPQDVFLDIVWPNLKRLLKFFLPVRLLKFFLPVRCLHILIFILHDTVSTILHWKRTGNRWQCKNSSKHLSLVSSGEVCLWNPTKYQQNIKLSLNDITDFTRVEL